MKFTALFVVLLLALLTAPAMAQSVPLTGEMTLSFEKARFVRDLSEGWFEGGYKLEVIRFEMPEGKSRPTDAFYCPLNGATVAIYDPLVQETKVAPIGSLSADLGFTSYEVKACLVHVRTIEGYRVWMKRLAKYQFARWSETKPPDILPREPGRTR